MFILIINLSIVDYHIDFYKRKITNLPISTPLSMIYLEY